MAQLNQSQVGTLRWFTGWFALGLVVFINLQSAFLATAIWLASSHGHDHHIAVQSDGDRVNIRLSHDHQRDHEGDDHVLRFNLNETPDQIQQRNSITAAPTSASSVTIASISSFLPPLISTQSPTVIPPESPPPLTAGLLGLRTTVLLV